MCNYLIVSFFIDDLFGVLFVIIDGVVVELGKFVLKIKCLFIC